MKSGKIVHSLSALALLVESVSSFQPILHETVAHACFTASTCQHFVTIATIPQASILAAAEQQAEALDKTTTTLVFLAGVFPFAVATVEFWRRIAVGDSFGTGSDSVVFTIGEDNKPQSSRGKQVLGADSLITAYILFAIAFGAIALALAAVLQAPSDPFVPLNTL